jgi:outer membrane receptor protein involved in Fe transport
MQLALRRRLLASTVLIGASMLSTAAFAQDAQTAETEKDDTIVVTGSLIANPNLERATPVTVATAEEIELRQTNTAEQLLRELPGTVPSIGSAVNNGNGGASFVNLRGIGSNRNVVLIDGVRLTPADLVGRFDLNNIPLALIERTEILTGGASTTYGADAVGGVINFITRRNFTGLDMQASNQITERGDGNVFRLDLTVGAGFDDGRGNVVMSLGYQEADPVYQGARDFGRFQIDSFNGTIAGSGTSIPTRFANVNPTGADQITAGCGAAGQPACSIVQGNRQITAAGGAFRNTAAFDAFNFNPFNIYQTPFKRYNMYAAANYDISDAVEFYARGLFSSNTVKTIIAPSGAFGLPVSVPLNNPFLTPALRNGFCALDTNTGVGYTPLLTSAQCAAAATATGPSDPNYREVSTNLFRRTTELGPRVSDFNTRIFDFQGGFRGALTSSINWDIFGSYGESENRQLQTGYILNSRVQQSLRATAAGCTDTANGCVPVDWFGPEGAITPAMADFLRAESTIITRTTLAQVRGTISGDFGVAMPWAEDSLAFAVGGEYRKYTASQQSDLLSRTGDLGGAGGVLPNIDGGFDVYEIYGEVVAPIVQDKPFFNDLTIGAGVRYSSYQVDTGSANAPSFNTTTWKVEGTWSPVEDLKIRGTFNRAVRAPNINELFSPVITSLTNLADDPCASLNDAGAVIRPVPTGTLRAICLAQGAPVSALGSIPVPVAGQAQSTGGGNLNLRPETSDSWTVGAVFTPTFLPGFSASIDYWNIKVTDAITAPTPGDAITACFGRNPQSPPAGAETTEACRIIRRNPIDGALSGDVSNTPGLFLTLTNAGRITTDGLDASMNYNTDLGFAKLSLNFAATWTFSNRFQSNPVAVNRECVGFYSVNCGSIQPEFFWTQRVTLAFDSVDVSLLWRHLSAVQYEPAAINRAQPSTIPYVGPVPGANSILPGSPQRGQLGTRDFSRIGAYDYFDLTTRFGVTDNLSLVMTVANLFDKQPPQVGNTIGSTAFNSGNTYPSTYDALGRTYRVTARLRF